MKPFVELGFMPEGLASGSKTIFWYRGNVTPPKDMTRWSNFIRAFVEMIAIHITQSHHLDPA